MKKIIMLTCIVPLILYCSSCTPIAVNVTDNETIQGSTLIKDNNYVYYYNQSINNKFGLYRYNTDTQDIAEIDSFDFYGDLFQIGDNLYYLRSENYDFFNVYCYNGTDVIDKGLVNDNLIYASGRRISNKECRLFLLKNTLYLLYNDKMYINTDGENFEVVASDISTFDIDNDNVYYADSSGTIYQKNAAGTTAIISPKEFEKIVFVNKTLANEYRITNIKKYDDYLYFLIADYGSGMGKCFRVSLENQQIEQLFEEGSTCKFEISKDMLYYYDFGSSQIICKSQGKTNSISVPANIFGFDIVEDKLYYSTFNSDGKSLSYFEMLNGTPKAILN